MTTYFAKGTDGMMNWLQIHMDVTSLLWLLPVVFMFHDFEEILTVEAWGNKHGPAITASLPPSLQKRFAPMMGMTTRNFAMDVLFVYILIVGVTFAAVFLKFYWLYLAVLAVFLAACLHTFGTKYCSEAIYPGCSDSSARSIAVLYICFLPPAV